MVFLMTYGEGEAILNLPGVKDALHKIAADQVLPKAEHLATEAGLTNFAAALVVEDGVRPKGRPYSRVVADRDDAAKYEFGDDNTARYRILGRASGVRIWPDIPS